MEYKKIKKIKNVNTESVYHLTVEKNHNFVANSMVVHNCDYRGSIGCILLNTSNEDFVIKQGDRIGQGILNEVKQINWIPVEKLEDLGSTVRGQGGFGHTGK